MVNRIPIAGEKKNLKVQEKKFIKDDKKIYILFLIIITILSTSTVNVHAMEIGRGDGEGLGELEGSVNTDIYQVVMPTDTKGVFDFILDPQGLINKTNAAAYDGMTFEKDCTVFFRRMDGKANEDYSSKSDYITIVNRSSSAVDVTVEVKIEEDSLEGIIMTEDKEFSGDSAPSLYLALVDGENVIPISQEGALLHATIDAAPEEAFEYIYDSDSGNYLYKMKEDVSGIEFDEYSFQLMGAANQKGNWSGLAETVPKIEVTWKAVPKQDETAE